jgi:hypothetical protein
MFYGLDHGGPAANLDIVIQKDFIVELALSFFTVAAILFERPQPVTHVALCLRVQALKQLGGLNSLLQLLQQWQPHGCRPSC